MPEISSFYGIVIYMYFNEHNPPHFHVKYADFNAIVTIEDDSSYEIETQIDEYDIGKIALGQRVVVKTNATDDEELDSFLFSLGCYSGETITVVSHLKGSCIVSIKDGRYNIDKQLAEAIII